MRDEYHITEAVEVLRDTAKSYLRPQFPSLPICAPNYQKMSFPLVHSSLQTSLLTCSYHVSEKVGPICCNVIAGSAS